METLLNLDAVTADHNLRGLRRLHDDVESHLRSLKALGINPDSYGAMLSPVLLNKLTTVLRLIISRKMSGSKLDIDTLRKTVEEELTARERTINPAQTTLPRRGQDKDKSRSTATTLFSDTRSPVSPPICSYCQQPHSSIDCNTVPSASAHKRILKTSGCCFNCLRKGHVSRDCRSPGKCRKCKRKHHSSICEELFPDRQCPIVAQPSIAQPTTVSTSQLNPEAAPYVVTPTSSNLCSDNRKTILLQTARARIYNPSNPQSPIEVWLLFDSGSQRSYINERTRKLLALEPSGEQRLSIATFGSNRDRPKVCSIVKVGMAINGYPHMHLLFYVVPMICEPLVRQPTAACIEECQHLAELELADFSDDASNLEVDILIGSDYYWDLVTGEVRRGTNGPTAIHTKLGWVLSGPAPPRELDQCSVNLITTHVLRADVQQSESESLDERLRSFWDLESLGIREPERTMYDEFVNTISFQDGRYQVSLPWKDFHDPLPNNYQLSLKRLWGLLRRLRQTPTILREYDNIIRDQLRKSIVEPVSEKTPTSGRLHYLPHHAVVRSDKATTKLRIVYDASAKSDGPSLNECLHTGPKFNQKILDILLRFRYFRIALTADIEKAFLMISIAENDRDVLRFLWVNDHAKDPPEECTLRFTRVVFGVSSSPFLLNATIKYHLEQCADSHPDLIRNLLQSTYVNDIATGADSEDEAFLFYSEANYILRHGGFNLRKFSTNSERLQQRIDDAEGPHLLATSESEETNPNYLEETYAEATLGGAQESKPEAHKILGVRWNPNND